MASTWIHPQHITFEVVSKGVSIGQLVFDLIDCRFPALNEAPPKLDNEDFLTKAGYLHGSIAQALGCRRFKVDRVWVGSGVVIDKEHWGHRHGRRAMREFLERWGHFADLVIINAFQLNEDGPDKAELIRLWKSIGFVLPPTATSRLFYAPRRHDL